MNNVNTSPEERYGIASLFTVCMSDKEQGIKEK